eukprot:gb/GEZN01004054.1/.p1 GENE.gb/GEZN01004054.1/~~gb/GEZN01004054.1/.p1  ORF type:complete len:636 (-),score=86.76 gb/GEZN01004054.1/:80-1987(-)
MAGWIVSSEYQGALSKHVRRNNEKEIVCNMGQRVSLLLNVLQASKQEVEPVYKREVKKPLVSSPTLPCSGFLEMQKISGKWEKYWFEYTDFALTWCADETRATPEGRAVVAYVESELSQSVGTSSSSSRTPGPGGPPGPVDPNASMGEPSLLDFTTGRKGQDVKDAVSQTATIRVVTTTRSFLLRSTAKTLISEFAAVMRRDLDRVLPDQLSQLKISAMQELRPLLLEQDLIQAARYAALTKTLPPFHDRHGYDEELPITSTRKEKSGVLSMALDEGTWQDFYFVLFDRNLFYYQDSKSTVPTGFVTLTYASLTLDPDGLNRGEFSFNVKTPLATVTCRTKHAVALSEWIACLQNTMTTQLQLKTKIRSTSRKVLEDIHKLAIDHMTMENLLTKPLAVQQFQKFISHIGHAPALDLYLAISKIKSKSSEEQEEFIKQFWKEFLAPGAPTVIASIPEEVRLSLQEKKDTAMGLDFLDPVQDIIKQHLERDFEIFKGTKHFRKLNLLHGGKRGEDLKRDVEVFDSASAQSFLLKVKGHKMSQEVKFSKKNHVFTIGRDKSNMLVIEDSRVSRSHARIEYTDEQCEYIDLGSSCGSKLNGKPVLRAKLRPGDVVEIGQSTLIFQLKRRRRVYSFPFSI